MRHHNSSLDTHGKMMEGTASAGTGVICCLLGGREIHWGEIAAPAHPFRPISWAAWTLLHPTHCAHEMQRASLAIPMLRPASAPNRHSLLSKARDRPSWGHRRSSELPALSITRQLSGGSKLSPQSENPVRAWPHRGQHVMCLGGTHSMGRPPARKRKRWRGHLIKGCYFGSNAMCICQIALGQSEKAQLAVDPIPTCTAVEKIGCAEASRPIACDLGSFRFFCMTLATALSTYSGFSITASRSQSSTTVRQSKKSHCLFLNILMLVEGSSLISS